MTNTTTCFLALACLFPASSAWADDESLQVEVFYDEGSDGQQKARAVGSMAAALASPDQHIGCTLFTKDQSHGGETMIKCFARDAMGRQTSCTHVEPTLEQVINVAGINAVSFIEFYVDENGSCDRIYIRRASY